MSNDGIASTGFANGRLFHDGDCDGVLDGPDEKYLGEGSGGAVPNHLTFYVEGQPDNSSIDNIDRIRSSFTAGNLYCRTDQGTMPINIRIDDGTAANMLASDLTCTTSVATTATFDGAHGGGLTAGDWVDITFGVSTGNPGVVTIIIDE